MANAQIIGCMANSKQIRPHIGRIQVYAVLYESLFLRRTKVSSIGNQVTLS